MTYRHIILSALMAGAAFTLQARVSTTPGDRIDAYTDATAFSSYLVDDIQSIAYKGNPLTGYTHVVLETADGTVELPIESLSNLVYSHVDRSIPFAITVKDTDHAKFRMLYNHNDPTSPNPIDPDKPYGWRGATAGDPVFYLLAPDKGYSCTYTVEGEYSGKDYTNVTRFITTASAEITAQFGIGIECLQYVMPFEPTVMTIAAQERNDFAHLPILGLYHGGRLASGTERLRSASSDELSFELKANTTFDMSTSETDPIELIDCYTYDADAKTLAHVPDPDDVNVSPGNLKVKWGISGQFDDNGVLFINARYIPSPTMENNRHYFALDRKCNFTIASTDGGDFRYLLEIRPESGENLYYFFENYGNKRTSGTMEFTRGNSLAEVSTAYFVYDGARQVKYELSAIGAEPVIKLKGNEAGTYTYKGSGTHSSLVLDGFGSASIDGKTCDYSLENGLVTLALSPELKVVIDTVNRTYTEKSADKWDGAKMFSTSKATGAYLGGEQQANCTVTLLLDQNYNGSANLGYAVVKVLIPRPDGSQAEENIGSGGAYVYDADAKTITVTNIVTYLWDGSDYVYGRRNLTFHLSDDLQSMWLGSEAIGDYLCGKRTASYIVTGQSCMLYADGKEPGSEQPAADITGVYTATAEIDMNGFKNTATVTLTIGDQKAKLVSNAMGTNLLDAEVDYTFADGVLTLKDFTVGDGSYMTTTADITFDYADGAFTGHGEYYSSNISAYTIKTILEGVKFTKE